MSGWMKGLSSRHFVRMALTGSQRFDTCVALRSGSDDAHLHWWNSSASETLTLRIRLSDADALHECARGTQPRLPGVPEATASHPGLMP